jgi:hypothetical protein
VKKIILIAVASFLMLNNVNAQTNKYESKIGLGVDFGFPIGDYKNTADYGVGVSLLYQKPVSENLSITGNVGYLRFHGPSILENINYKEGFVPIKAGARYFIAPYLYGAGELGVAFSTAYGRGAGTAFVYVPSLGTEFSVSNSGTVDVGLRYECWSRGSGTLSFVGLRAGYNF